jgi:hypothetical protein
MGMGCGIIAQPTREGMMMDRFSDYLLHELRRAQPLTTESLVTLLGVAVRDVIQEAMEDTATGLAYTVSR